VWLYLEILEIGPLVKQLNFNEVIRPSVLIRRDTRVCFPSLSLFFSVHMYQEQIIWRHREEGPIRQPGRGASQESDHAGTLLPGL
jgi:hypothetical protein